MSIGSSTSDETAVDLLSRIFREEGSEAKVSDKSVEDDESGAGNIVSDEGSSEVTVSDKGESWTTDLEQCLVLMLMYHEGVSSLK